MKKGKLIILTGLPTQNLVLQSEDLTNAAWAKQFVTTPAVDTLLPATNNSTVHRVYNNADITLKAATVYSLEFEAKANGYSWLLAVVNEAGSAAGGVYFDTTNGVKGFNGSSILASSIASVGAGWFKCALTVRTTTGAIGAACLFLSVCPADGSDTLTSWTPDGTSSILVRKVHLHKGAIGKAKYAKTTTTAVGS